MKVSALLAFTEGVTTFISPCTLPLLPVYIAYMAGDNVESNNLKRFLNIIGFIIGFSLIFIILGATATSLGQLFKENSLIIRKVSGIIMIIFGLSYAGFFRIKFLENTFRINFQPERLNFVKSILFGIVFAFSWSPCAGRLLGVVLLLAASEKTVISGILLLFIYSMGLAIPFILTALLIDKLKRLIRWLTKYQGVINIVSGLVLVAAGVLVFLDKFKYLNTLFF